MCPLGRARDRSRGRGGATSAAWTPASLGALLGWWRADYGVTTPDSVVSAWLDKGGAGKTLSQGTGANQPTHASADANFAGKASVAAASAPRFVVGVAAADWKALHNGSGATLVAVFRSAFGGAVQTVWDSCNATGTNVGVGLYYNGTSGNLNALVANGAAAIVNATGANTVTPGSVHVAVFAYSEAATPKYLLEVDGAAYLSGSPTGSPSASNPAFPLALLGTGGALAGMVGATPEAFAVGRYLTAGERAQAVAYVRARYGF